MDRISRQHRSWNMSRITGRNTKPELIVRSLLHRLGYRFRLHRADLPGRPDIVLPRHRVILEVKGCFWHGHFCLNGRIPSGPYWGPKILRTKTRDRTNAARLRALEWRVFSVWECKLLHYSP